MKFRHELKHSINTVEYMAIRQRVNAVCKKDANSNGAYTVKSLYFDNFYDEALKEKLEGFNKREKFRIRYYGTDKSFIRLEKKSKINSLCNKVSAVITEEEVQRLINNDYEFLKNSKDPLLLELYSKMKTKFIKPKTIVIYEREAFVYTAGNVRITFDSKIRTGINSVDFLNDEVITLSTGNNTILEVKYDEFIPQVILDAVQTGGQSAKAFSKYAVARMYI